MLALETVDLPRDAAAAIYVKDEVVEVEFATAAGVLQSREGPNHYVAGDALITGSTGDRWSVARARFEAKYESLVADGAGRDGRHRAKPVPVWAKQVDRDFSIARRAGGDLLRGRAGDWMLQYAPGDFGVVENARFQKVYRPA